MCGLVQGDVAIGVRPVLPVHGVDIILGNDLAGSRIWASVVPPPLVTLSPAGLSQPDESAVRFPEVFPACAVTWVMSRTRVKLPCLPVFPLSVSHSELRLEQGADPALEGLFGSVWSDSKVGNVASGYCLQEGILTRKWVPHGEDFLGEPIFQVVVPGSGVNTCS